MTGYRTGLPSETSCRVESAFPRRCGRGFRAVTAFSWSTWPLTGRHTAIITETVILRLPVRSRRLRKVVLQPWRTTGFSSPLLLLNVRSDSSSQRPGAALMASNVGGATAAAAQKSSPGTTRNGAHLSAFPLTGSGIVWRRSTQSKVPPFSSTRTRPEKGSECPGLETGRGSRNSSRNR